MNKNILPNWQTQAAAFADPRYVVNTSAELASNLTHLRSRGTGDTSNAMRAIEHEYGIAFSILWALRYRRDRVKDVATSVFFKLRAAYEAECARQIRKLEHETYIARQLAGAGGPAVAEAELVLKNTRAARCIQPSVLQK